MCQALFFGIVQYTDNYYLLLNIHVITDTTIRKSPKVTADMCPLRLNVEIHPVYEVLYISEIT